ncbi:MAG: peptidoglycan/xylan/chitin deacetylase (PgdA/CDA1 family) [Neolewinella sp.]|jgi:peptidoglycan/xylan/chitin deacetylase (PgdA/CDA1 family)
MKVILIVLLFGLMSCGVQKAAVSRSNQPQVILKLDDVWSEGKNVHPGWSATFDYLNELDVVGTIGIIGGRGTNPVPAYYSWLKAQAERGHELWNHGWCHCKGEGDVREFRGNDFTYQHDHLVQTQRIIKDKTGITLTAFGAPYNSVDAVTATALAAVEDLKIWMYPSPGIKTDKAVLPRIAEVNIEYPVHQPNFERFRAGYLAHQHERVLVIQGHPRSWMTEGRLDTFKKIIEFLRQRNTVFTTPTQYEEALEAARTQVQSQGNRQGSNPGF